MTQAAACGIPYLVAWMGLVEAGDLQAGEKILITGALGAVGLAATQIAHWRGAKVIGADRSNATGIVNTGDLVWVNQVREFGSGGVDVVLDAVGGALFEDCLRCLRQGGRQIALASSGDRRVSFDLTDFYHKLLRLSGIDTFQLKGEGIARMMNSLKSGFESRVLHPPEVEEHSLNEAVEAYAAVTKGTAGKRQILVCD
jgi:NADPH:quinone reductase-like Zn-dependent oxidoreductase